VLYGLCIVRRALPPSAQPPGEPAQPPCHVQARARPCVPFHAGILSGILSTVAGAGTLCMVWCQLARWCLARTCATAVAAARQACWGDQWVATRVVPLSWRPPASVTSVARWWVVSRRARAGAGAVLHRGAGHRGRRHRARLLAHERVAQYLRAAAPRLAAGAVSEEVLSFVLTLGRTPSGVWLHAAPRSACKAGARSPASPAYDSERALARRGEPRDASAADAASSQPGWKPHQALRSAWPAVYACMGVAAWLVWRRGGLAAQAAPLAAYLALLAASWLAWPPLFGGGHPLRRACADALGAPPPAPSSDTAWRGSAALQWLQVVSAQMRYEGMFFK